MVTERNDFVKRHYHAVQGPGRALKVIAHLNEMIGEGPELSAEDNQKKANTARIAFEKMLKEMKDRDVAALYASTLSLHHIVMSAQHTTEQEIDSRGLVFEGT